MKDCILSLFWPKKAIYGFFRDCSVPVSSLRKISNWEGDNLQRTAMVDRIFESLDREPGSGTMHYSLMLDQLSGWDYFDPYWFEVQGKLDRSTAIKSIEKLKAAKVGQLDRSHNLASRERDRVASLQQKHASMEDMREDFLAIATKSGTPQKRGYALEGFLAKMARFFELRVTNAFKIIGTQIDGGIKYDGENYNLEAKWEHQMMSDEPVLAFCRKQEMNMHGRGIFISINGFTEGALTMLKTGNVKNTFLMDGEDITLILQELLTLSEVLDAKVEAAQTKGQFYINPVTKLSKL